VDLLSRERRSIARSGAIRGRACPATRYDPILRGAQRRRQQEAWPMKVWMTYNPNCGTARNVLALLRERGIEPEIREYLKQPLTRDEIAALVAQMNVPVRDVVRSKEPLYAELGLATADDDALLDAMVKHPILLNRPIVSTPKGVKLCRPSEAVQALI
jgi:arsenate reductase